MQGKVRSENFFSRSSFEPVLGRVTSCLNGEERRRRRRGGMDGWRDEREVREREG